eukprot:COSAG01_NODE_4774_length_4751_cov_46.489467_6_plen_56_part_01
MRAVPDIGVAHPVRDADDPEYSRFVDSLGDNTVSAVPLVPGAHEVAYGVESKLCLM